MIPKKVGTDVDLNAQLDKELKKSQELQKEKIEKNKPKLMQVIGNKYVKYIFFVFIISSIVFKIIFAPKPTETKKKQANKNKITKSNSNQIEQQRFADKSIVKNTGGKIENEKTIVSFDTQMLSNSEIINNVEVPKLNIPATPRLPEIDKITIKDVEKNTEVNNNLENEKEQKKKNDDRKQNKSTTVKRIKKRIKDSNGKTKIIEVEAEIDDEGNIIKESIKNDNIEYSVKKPLSEQLANGNKKLNERKQTSIDGSLGAKSLDEMFILSGKGVSGVPKHTTSDSKNDFILFDGSSISEQEIVTSQSDANVSKITNLEHTIITGKIIEAVLETAINSESPGIVRAVVSKDVLGEIGNKILIPKGSRVFGSYSVATTVTQTRVLITWTRIIRPDGVVISINADTYDQVGKKGLEGDINTRYGELLKNSLLYSFINLGTAVAIEKIAGIKGTTSIIGNGGASVLNTSPANVAATSLIETTKDIVDKMSNGLTKDLKPTITIDQGRLLQLISSSDLVINVSYRRQAQDVRID